MWGGCRGGEQRPQGDPGREAKECRAQLLRRDLLVMMEISSPVLFRVAMERLKCRWGDCILDSVDIETQMDPRGLWPLFGKRRVKGIWRGTCMGVCVGGGASLCPAGGGWHLPPRPFPWEPVRNSLPSGATVTLATGLSQGWVTRVSTSCPGLSSAEPQTFSLVLRGHVWLSDKLLHQRGCSLAAPCL